MQKIRASTQLYDDSHLLLTADDIDRITKAILTEPESGEYKVYSLQRNEDGGWRIAWEDVPES